MLLWRFIPSPPNYPIGQSFNKTPTNAEWARFRKYARRIRAFRVNPSLFPIPPEVLSVLEDSTLGAPLLLGLRTFVCIEATVAFIPFISLFLSRVTTMIAVNFVKFLPTPPTSAITSMIATPSTRCPDLRRITLHHLPRSPVVVATVSEMLLACNRNTLQSFDVDSPLTEAARKVLSKLPNLRVLRLALEGPTLLPPMVLPNLVGMYIIYPYGHEWLRSFYGAVLNNLTYATFYTTTPYVGDFLEVFEGVGRATSISATLSTFQFYSFHPWSPTYSSLLAFKQLTNLTIASPCRIHCSSTVDDDIVINLARAMPKLKVLQLGLEPCQTLTGVTVKGLVELACHCISLSTLRVHLRVDSLVQAAVGEVVPSPPNDEHAASREECALMTLEVGNTPIPEGTALIVALALLHIFPRISDIKHTNTQWGSVARTIILSRRLSSRIGALAHSSRSTADMP